MQRCLGGWLSLLATMNLAREALMSCGRSCEFAAAAGVASKIEIDPTLARGLSYYTGAIMEINVKDLPGSLGGGGRYDNLVGMFFGQDVPACGFSLGLERIIVVMTEREMFPRQCGYIACGSDGGDLE